MILSHIVAAAENGVIGVNNALPWNIPEDTKFFKDKTKGHIIIMGRKTYDSMGKALPNRLNIVITRQKDLKLSDAVVVPTIKDAVEYAQSQQDHWPEEIFIIGGGEIYRESLPMVDLVYLTRIHQEVPGDAKYPELPPGQFSEIERRERPGTPNYTFFVYRRK